MQMNSDINFLWDLQELDFNEEAFYKYEPNFTVTQVKLSKQNTLNLTKLDSLPKIELIKPANITQNNIIYINNVETKSSNEKASIIINNIFAESPNGIAKQNSFSRKNEENSLPKSIFRDKSPFRNSKKVSFNNQLIAVFKENERNLKEKRASSLLAKNNKKKTCKGCVWF